MKKIYKIEVDCAHCAAKAEDAAKKVDGVIDLAINFMTQKMTVVFADGVYVYLICTDMNEEISRYLQR